MRLLYLAALLDLLAHDSFVAREAGQGRLRALAAADPARVGPVVAAAERHHPSPEARSRCGRLAGLYRAHLADAFTPSTVPVWPAADALTDWPTTAHYRAQAGDPPAGHPWGSPYWWGYRRAAELYTRDQIRCGEWSPADADAALARAWRRELDEAADTDGGRGWLPTMRAWTWRRTGGYPRPATAFGAVLRP